MILGNYYKAMGALMLCDETPIALKDIHGSERIFKQGISAYMQSIANEVLGFGKLGVVSTAKANKSSVYFGTGTTPPTMEDYFLSGDVISGISYNSAQDYTVDSDGSVKRTVLYTVTNANETDITIGEIGYAGHLNGSPGCYCMVERTVLDNPITIPAGGVGHITYTIRMNYPTA